MTEKNQEHQDHADVGLYEKILERTEEILKSSRQTLDEALKKAGEDLVAAESYTREQAERMATFVRRDLGHAADQVNKTAEQLKAAVTPQRLAAGAQSLFAKILTTASEQLGEWAKKAEAQLEFKTGEITSPGTLTCRNCFEELHMKRTARIPPCPKCRQTLFRKSY